MKGKRGITLVSLVVTIIVLIILAGVSINLTLGENGIITMARKARENMELAKTDEERQLNELYMQMEQEGLSGGISYDAIAKLVEFKRQIASAITDMGIETAENADASTMSSNIRSILGTATAEKISYDNTNSELTSTNVQGAVDELDNNFSNMGTSTLILNTTSTTEEINLVDNITKYRYVLLLGLSSDAKNTLLIPTDIFINDTVNNFEFVSGNWGNITQYFSRFKVGYVSNTQIKTNIVNSGGYTGTLYIYGIK